MGVSGEDFPFGYTCCSQKAALSNVDICTPRVTHGGA